MSKVAFISGASRGIGRATAIAFAKAGYRVAITARELDSEVAQQSTQGSLKQTAQMMDQLGCEVIALKMDLLDFNSVASALKQVFEHFGKIDVVVNNAIYQGAGLNASLLRCNAANA